MLVKYSADEIVTKAMNYLTQNTEIDNFSAGSIARSIFEAIAPEIGESGQEGRASLYQFMEEVLNQGFVSRATNEHLDLIGELVNYKRRTHQIRDELGNLVDELIDDTMYRYEITQQILTMMSANETALRFELLLINGVSDIIGREYVLGTGSFSFILIEEEGYNSQDLLQEANETIRRVKGHGIRGFAELPANVSMDLTIRPVMKAGTISDNIQIAKVVIKQSLERWIASKVLGEGIIYNEMVHEIMSATNFVEDFQVITWNLNDSPVMLMNQEIDGEERLTVGVIEVL